MAKEKQKKEETRLAASYVETFFAQVGEMIRAYSIYQNTILEINFKSLETVEETDKQILLNAISNLRYMVISVMQQYRIFYNMQQPTEEEKQEHNKIEQIYKDNIKGELMPNSDKVEELIGLIQKFLTSKIMRNLLETSQDFLAGLNQE